MMSSTFKMQFQGCVCCYSNPVPFGETSYILIRLWKKRDVAPHHFLVVLKDEGGVPRG
jgi:hypothetical protein